MCACACVLTTTTTTSAIHFQSIRIRGGGEGGGGWFWFSTMELGMTSFNACSNRFAFARASECLHCVRAIGIGSVSFETTIYVYINI